MAQPGVTPVRRQYLDIKKQFPGAIVFFRLGDFYETFDSDAETVARELDIVLTSRNVSKDMRVPMAGVPHHAAENYIARLIDKGYHVAICDQVGDEPIEGLMPREVVRVITPGTITEPALLPEKQNNYLVAVAPLFSGSGGYTNPAGAGIAYLDVSTGEFAVTQFVGDEGSSAEVLTLVQQELARLAPRECLLPQTIAEHRAPWLGIEEARISPLPDWQFEPVRARQLLEQHFKVGSLQAFGLEGLDLAICASGAALAYLQDTQKGTLSQITTLSFYTTEEYMVLDAPTRRNLELLETLRDRRAKGSLLGILDRTVTAMGGRLLRRWLSRPLLDLAQLQARQDQVEALYVDGMLRAQVREVIKMMSDLERLTNRILTGMASPREITSLKETLDHVPALRGYLISQSQALRDLGHQLDPVEPVSDQISRALADDPPSTTGSVGLIRAGYSEELDTIIRETEDARRYINSLEAVERARTGIKTLKVGFNKVFGYYIEITRSNSDMVPEDYIRKQTLVNAERYITPEMKDVEVRLLNAEEEIHTIELALYKELLKEIGGYSAELLRTARAVAQLDVISTLADVAARNGYTRPFLSEDDVLHIRAGRHPVVEELLSGERFVPNDTTFSEQERIHVITGPNMSGKSTYLRQVALIVLLAQIGSFVPAEEAHIGLVDRIFTRIGAQDEIHAGQSTFMVEMIEAATILQQSTRRSLIVLDELGRGTSTYDGLAIARAVIEYLHNHPRMGGKTLFATHYHELTELESILPGVANYSVSVAEQGEQIVFLHTIVAGKADKSYGIHVAQLAGVPKGVVQRAAEILRELEENSTIWQISALPEEHKPGKAGAQLSFFQAGPHPAVEALRKIRVEEMSPIDAITTLYELQRMTNQDNS